MGYVNPGGRATMADSIVVVSTIVVADINSVLGLLPCSAMRKEGLHDKKIGFGRSERH